MKPLTLEQARQLLTGIQVANVCLTDFDDQKMGLAKDDPIRIHVESIQNKVESLKELVLHVDDEAYALMQQISAAITDIQGQIHARKYAH
ncbi:hypothetical protein [Vibrio cincinnatiensis]|uniref:hypothetical protein n=1 Tax=Vibrio cincinnatiensis TaxID=675 RepID=UPI001FAAAD58|nr:hypothetical protein [Vibrio cincinnatiensis]